MLLHQIPKKKLLLLAGDILLICTAFFLAPAIRFGFPVFHPSEEIWEAATVILLFLFCFYVSDLYTTDIKFLSARFLFRFAAGIIAALSLSVGVFFFVRQLITARSLLVITVLLAGTLTFAWRLLFEFTFKRFIQHQKRILIVGSGGDTGRDLYRMMKASSTYKVVGFIDDEPGKVGTRNSPEVLGTSVSLVEIVDNAKAEGIVFAVKRFRSLKNPDVLRAILDCKMKGLEVFSLPSLYEELSGRIPIDQVTDYWFINTALMGIRPSIYNKKVKRLVDVLLSLVGLAVSLIPVFITTAVAIALESRGPVFYRQKRVGLNGIPFNLLKFRSMRQDAEANGPVWASKGDERATGVGRVIRKLRIDEIPQFWNVLRGDMSFIGPRPERPEFVKELSESIPYYSLRHCVKPGITGWAQVNYPYGSSEADAFEKLQYDLYYIKNLSPFLDFHILLRTMRTVLFGKGAH